MFFVGSFVMHISLIWALGWTSITPPSPPRRPKLIRLTLLQKPTRPQPPPKRRSTQTPKKQTHPTRRRKKKTRRRKRRRTRRKRRRTRRKRRRTRRKRRRTRRKHRTKMRRRGTPARRQAPPKHQKLGWEKTSPKATKTAPNRVAPTPLGKVDLSPRATALDPLERPGGKADAKGYRSMAALYPHYHREFKARLKALHTAHDPFYEDVAERLRRCWARRLPALIHGYNKRYPIAQRKTMGFRTYKGHVVLTWYKGKPHLRWTLPRPSSPASFLELPTHTPPCLRHIDIPARFQKYRKIAGKWNFYFTVGVQPLSLTNVLSAFMWQTVARHQVHTVGIYKRE